MEYAYIPRNLQVEEVIPKELAKFSDDAKYFIHKIYEQRVFNRRRPDDFIPLKMEYMRRVMSIRKYSAIKRFLLENGIIESDDHFIRGQKATGYRLGKKYIGQKHKKEIYKSEKLLSKVENYKREIENEIKLDTHIHLWGMLKKISIDYNATLQELPEEDWASNHIAVEMIRDKNWFFRPDKYGRVHTNISNLKTCFRKCLSVDKEKLVEIDIANSQPFFMGMVLQEYLRGNGNLTSFNINKPPSLSLLRNILPSDVREYLALVQDGCLYEFLWDKFDISVENRKTFKVKIFAEVFFCKNGWRSKNQKLFASIFPTVFSVIQELKKKDYKALSRHLQKVESSFIINKVVRRCMELIPDMFVTTIHDSFLLKQEDVNFVLGITEREFRPWGLQPKLRVKE